MNTSKYKRLAYIQNTDRASYIEIPVSFNQDTYMNYVTNIVNSTNRGLMGSKDSIHNEVIIETSQYWYDDNTVVLYNGVLNLGKHDFIVSGRGYVKIDGKQIAKENTAKPDWSINTVSIGVNTGSYNAIQNFIGMTLYNSLDDYNNKNFSHSFIPCKRLEDNAIGVYDLVTDTFYPPTRGKWIAPFLFSEVTALQIPEGNVTKIENKEGNILWANINKLAYGVRWNSVNQATTACERIGNPELHKTLPIQSRFKVCIHKGKEIQYYCHPDDSRFVEDSKKAEFTHQKADMNLTACDGLPTGVVSCEENSVVKCKFINENLFSNYRFLYSYVYIQDNVSNAMAIGRIIYIDTSTHEAYIDDSENIQLSDYVYNESVDRYPVSDAIDRPWFSDSYTVVLGCSINGYDGEIGVDTGGKFYQWSVDNDGDGNEVWQSLYKCVPYAREIKRHIIGIDRACVLNTAFNDTKWGWIGSLEADTAVDVINYHTNLRGGGNTTTFDSYLGVDNFRCQFGKARTNLELATMRSYSQKTDGGQMLYKQIWEAIVWSYVIEYANFDVKKAYNAKLTTEGYHQGGLGSGVGGGQNLGNYNEYQKFVPNDYTLEFGNKTDIKIRANRQWDTPVAANNYWDSYYTSKVVATKSSDNKILTITSTKILTTNWNIYAGADKVGSVTRYKITGLTDDQTVVFKREKGNLTITTDGTYDVEWGTGDNQRKIYFGKLQTDCNIVIEIISAPAYNIIQNQNSWNVPHWRGFNVFWYGDISINIDNMLNKNNYDTDKDEKIWYYTDDISKFDDTIDNKEHQIKGLGKANNDWLKEVRINDKGDIVPSKLYYNGDYKNSYHHNDNYDSINCTVVGGYCIYINYNGLLFLSTDNSIYVPSIHIGFVKVTILDN